MISKKLLGLVTVLISIILFTSCKERVNDDVTQPQDVTKKSVASCEGCHSNYEMLKKVYTPDPPSDEASHGCGGEAPHIEPFDRVYLGGNGYENFKNDVHGKIPCIGCHNGVDKTDDKSKAHSGDFIKKPSLHADQKCSSCHTEIYLKTKNSLHEQGWGQKSMVVLRSGNANIPAGFEQLSDQMKEGYNKNCSTCHGTCGDCHVNRPKGGGGGLYAGHQFFRKPDMRDHCVTCHVSRGGHAYFGQAAGTQPDVHLTKAQFSCTTCHSQNEVHGDGNIYDQRYKMPLMPKCENCHTTVSNSNQYHKAHLSTFSCNTCHSQDYNNCGSCHIGAEGARVPSYLGFKIGMNPIPETRDYKYAVLRRSLTAPDSWDHYGTASLSNFNVKPTYKYSTPHNILKWTKRTTVESGKPCYDACHIIKNSDGSYRNKEIYLFKTDLDSWEVQATQNITVDNKLPSKWNVN